MICRERNPTINYQSLYEGWLEVGSGDLLNQSRIILFAREAVQKCGVSLFCEMSA
jgi:hypothetical protein